MMNTNDPEKELTGSPSIDKLWLKYSGKDVINAPCKSVPCMNKDR